MSDDTPMEDAVLDDFEEYLSTGQVAKMLNLTSLTVTKHARAGKIRAGRTPGGHFRFARSEVEYVLRHGYRKPSEDA